MAPFSVILACVSLVTISAAELASPSSLRIGTILLALSIGLLLASFTRSYWIVAILLSCCAGGFAVVRRFRGRLSTTTTTVNGRIGIKSERSSWLVHLQTWVLRLLPPALATLFHVLALWILPFCILFGLTDAQSDPEFFGQEVGHIAPATFYIVGLVALPLLVLPPGFQNNATTVHQLWESIFNTTFSLVYFLLFRIVHHFRGQDPPHMSAPNWDHEFLGLVFFGAGLIGIILALQDVRTSIHVSFPTAFVAFSMLSHSNAHHADMADVAEGWRYTWMKLHAVHGMLFGIGALCRLIDRIPESLFFFFIGAFTFVTSAQYIVQSMDASVDYKDDPESAGAGRYPTDHVVPLLVVTVATIMYALFLGTATRLRMCLDRDAEVGGDRGTFEALPTSDAATEHDLSFDSKEIATSNGPGERVNGRQAVHQAGL